QEKRIGASEKVVATAYRGLIGKFVPPKEVRLPHYESQVAKNDPLRIKNPQPLVTWDANNQPEVPVVVDDGTDDTGEDRPDPIDRCPDMAGLQLNPNDCASSGGGGGGGSEPPVEEPPVDGGDTGGDPGTGGDTGG